MSNPNTLCYELDKTVEKSADKGIKWWRVIKAILGDRSPESDTFLRRVEGSEDAGLYFEGLGLQPVASTDYLTTKDVHLTVLEFNMAGRKWFGIVDIAARMAKMSESTIGQFAAMCESFGVKVLDAVNYQSATIVLADTIRTKLLNEVGYMRDHAREVTYETRTYALADAKLIKSQKEERWPTVTVPPRLAYEHAGNSLVGDPIFEELPELNGEWINFVAAIRRNPRVLVVKKKYEMGQPAKLEYRTVRLHHPEYGRYGTFNYRLKENFHGWCEPVIEQQTRTYSTALTDHIPAFLPRWNRRSAFTNLMGGAGRLGRQPVPPQDVDYETMEPFMDRARDHLIHMLEQAGLVRDENTPTPETAWRWLASTHFPAAKKMKYAQAFVKVEVDDHHFKDARYFSNVHSAFPKNELYVGLDKPQRQILAGDLQMAAVLGPVCDRIGNYFFSLPITSKKIPERLRPRYAIERFGDGHVILNDMSAYEGSITPYIKNKFEHAIFRHFNPGIAPWLERCDEDLELVTNGAHFSLPNCRCSGDPQTSLGNSITNYCSIMAAFLYALSRQRFLDIEAREFILQHALDQHAPNVWVEGDDSLVQMNEFFNRPGFFDDYEIAFRKMGFSTKMEEKDFVGNAGYCSMYFTRKAKNAPSLAQTILDFPWCHTSNFRRGTELLALKALSLANSAPGMPIAWAIAQHYAPKGYMTAKLNYNDYEREELEREGYDVTVTNGGMIVHLSDVESHVEVPDNDDRNLFEQRYLISKKEQEMIESAVLEKGIAGIPVDKVRLMCTMEGLNYDDFAMFYEDNIAEPDPINDYYEYHVLHVNVENGVLTKTIEKRASRAVVHQYGVGRAQDVGYLQRKIIEAEERRIRRKAAFKASLAAKLDTLNKYARIIKKCLLAVGLVVGIVLLCVFVMIPLIPKLVRTNASPVKALASKATVKIKSLFKH